MYFLKFPKIEMFRLITSHWSTILWGFVVLVALKVLWWYGNKTSRMIQASFPGIPGPKPLPFIGYMHEFIRYTNNLHLMLDKYYKQYGKVYSMMFGSSAASLVVCDPKMIKDILVKRFDCFYDRPVPFELPEPLDSFMSIVKGKRWKRIRHTLSPTFTAYNMKLMVPLMNMSCDTLMKKIEKASQMGESFDVVKYQQTVTLEIILSIVFGIQSDCQNNPNDPIMTRAIDAMQPSPFKQFLFNVLIPLLPFGEKLTRTDFGARFIFSSIYDLAGFTKDIIKERKASGQSRMDMLELMLKATDPGNESDRKLTEDEVVAQCLIFFLAGYETTSTTLALVCHHLAVHRDAQEKLQQEIDSVWIDEDTMPSYETVHELPYLEMVISETLRLYPPGFMLFRKCMKECVIEGIRIPEGASVMMLAYSLHRDPTIYPDPDHFIPERFNAEAKESRHPYAYMPFGHGPRHCIGLRFAQMEMKLVLVRILKRFNIIATPETKVPPDVGVKNTLSVLGSVKVGVTPRVKQ